MITSLSNIKLISGITADASIYFMEPIVLADIISITGLTFETDITLTGSATFDTSDAKISITGIDDMYLKPYDVIKVSGSHYNDGYYGVSTISAGEVVIEPTATLTDETATVTITVLSFGKEIEYYYPKMIGYKFKNRSSIGNIASESYGSVSKSYSISGNFSLYSDEIMIYLMSLTGQKQGFVQLVP